MYKHLTIEKRVLIEDRLNQQKSIRSIAKELAVAPSTVLREINRHTITIKETGNYCAIRKDCAHKHLCKKEDCKSRCSKVNVKSPANG